MTTTSTNRGVVYKGPGKVEVQAIDFPRLPNPKRRASLPTSSCWTPIRRSRPCASVLASIRHGQYLFKRPDPGYEIELDLFRKTR